MVQTVAFEQDAREAIRQGVSQLARTVRTTLGPRGRNVIFDTPFGSPTVTKDGVTVAKQIELEDSYENVGVKLVREVASKTNDMAGDGTTTATVLADAILQEGLKVTAAGAKPVELTRGIRLCVQDIVEQLKTQSIPVNGRDQIAQVASIAANNDPQIGNCIADCIDMVGQDGVITIEQGQSLTNEVEWVQGMRFDNGYLSPYFVSQTERMEIVLDDVYILVHEKKISNVQELLPLLNLIAEAEKPLLIIAESVEGEALSTLIINQLRGTFRSCAVKAPGYGDRRKAMLDDIAILTGAVAITEHLGVTLENVTLEHLGRAKQIVITKDDTTIIEGLGTKAAIKDRVTQLASEIELATSDYDREQLVARKAKLSSGVAKIRVGGATESEVKEKKMRFEDALSATRAAIDEGVQPGGGVALLRAVAACKPATMNHDTAAGYDIIRRACRSPLRWIAANAGHEGSVVVQRVVEGEGHWGFNAATGVYEDMVKAGVIDATRVIRCALENAASVSTLLVTSGAVIATPSQSDQSHE